MTDPARHQWWKKKRWWAAVVLLLIIAYPASLGPLTYCFGRGWITSTAIAPYVKPVTRRLPLPARRMFMEYLGWWRDLGFRHCQLTGAGFFDRPLGRIIVGQTNSDSDPAGWH